MKLVLKIRWSHRAQWAINFVSRWY